MSLHPYNTLSGWTKEPEGARHVVKLVCGAEALKEARGELADVTSSHVYSIQRGAVAKDPAAMLASDSAQAGAVGCMPDARWSDPRYTFLGQTAQKRRRVSPPQLSMPKLASYRQSYCRCVVVCPSTSTNQPELCLLLLTHCIALHCIALHDPCGPAEELFDASPEADNCLRDNRFSAVGPGGSMPF